MVLDCIDSWSLHPYLLYLYWVLIVLFFANLFCLVMRRECLLFFSDKNHADAIETFNFTSRYLVDLKKIDISLLKW